MTDAELKNQFYKEVSSGGHPADEPYYAFDAGPNGPLFNKIILDGRFSLAHLKKIVEAWERLNNAR